VRVLAGRVPELGLQRLQLGVQVRLQPLRLHRLGLGLSIRFKHALGARAACLRAARARPLRRLSVHACPGPPASLHPRMQPAGLRPRPHGPARVRAAQPAQAVPQPCIVTGMWPSSTTLARAMWRTTPAPMLSHPPRAPCVPPLSATSWPAARAHVRDECCSDAA